MTVHVIATGGTISSHHDGRGWVNLDGATLIAELGADTSPRVVVHDVAAGPSSNLGVDAMVAIARRVQAALDQGADGVVVVHGTDTMELTAFVTQLLVGTSPGRRPVVFTGSMRVHSHPAPDGPGNLVDAIAVAASDAAVGREVMVCLGGRIHAADRVSKRDAASLDAFDSAPLTALGRVVGGAVTFDSPPPPARPRAVGLRVEVPLVACYPGIPAELVAETAAGRRGIVVEAFGDLNLPHQLWAPLHEAWSAGAMVVLASRSFTPTVSNEDLELLGAVGAGGLTAQKARLAAMAALDTCAEREDALAFLSAHAPEHHTTTGSGSG